MDYLFTKDVKSITETNHLWQFHDHFGLGCKEDDDIVDDLVLKFSIDAKKRKIVNLCLAWR
ncbi:hypothetical protein TSAR_004932 [Trichomalopsis sarcophagae]|uniref:Uncharacterized protein n=1 Tax=Trichomalopsis sarcophagae TaxID=543379 RepID=A0A232F9U1_9HYME|nr:hypothetical protein TSAR_004932 [Trichomalopsis sarcophagae]